MKRILLLCFVFSIVLSTSAFHHEKNDEETLKSMEGLWVSDISTSDGQPYYVLSVMKNNDEGYKVLMAGRGYCTDITEALMLDKHENPFTAQKFDVVTPSHVYAVWSTEGISAFDLSSEQAIYNVSNKVVSTLTSPLSDTWSSLIGVAVDALLSKWLTPEKYIEILQGEFLQLNDNEIVASFIRQSIKAKADKSPDINKQNQNVIFSRWTPDSRVYYIDEYLKPSYVYLFESNSPYSPLYEENKKSFVKYGTGDFDAIFSAPEYKKWYLKYDYRQEFAHYQQLVKQNKKVNLRCFNLLQQNKLKYYNEQVMLKNNMPINKVLHSDKNHSTIGCTFEDISHYANIAKKTGQKGVWVKEVSVEGPAQLFGIREKDVLLSIDGFELNTPEQAESFICSITPFTTVKVEVLRKGKILKLPVELGYQIFIEQ